MMSQLALKDAKTRFLKFGFCKHDPEFIVTSKPRGTNVTLTNCGVCGKEYDREHHTAA